MKKASVENKLKKYGMDLKFYRAIGDFINAPPDIYIMIIYMCVLVCRGVLELY